MLDTRHGVMVVGKASGKFALVEAVAKVTNSKIVARFNH